MVRATLVLIFFLLLILSAGLTPARMQQMSFASSKITDLSGRELKSDSEKIKIPARKSVSLQTLELSDLLKEHGATNARLVCIVSAPEGVAEVEKHHPGTIIHTAALDRTLNARKYILPGLGDFGDRLYGT